MASIQTKWSDFIALRGDLDKLPGAPGVGPKRAAQLVQRYGTPDGVFDPVSFKLRRRFSASIGSSPRWMRLPCLPMLADQAHTRDLASTLARSWGLKQSADRLMEKA